HDPDEAGRGEARQARREARHAPAGLRLPRPVLMRIQVNARNRSFQFEAGPEDRVLYAGLASGVELPYECATGTCGTCKAKVVQGEVIDTWPEAPGRKYLKVDRGEGLMCQCVARGDVALEVASF